MSYIRVLHLFVKVMLYGQYTITRRRTGVVISITVLGLWGAIAYRLEGRTLNRENSVSNPTAVASNLWQV